MPTTNGHIMNQVAEHQYRKCNVFRGFYCVNKYNLTVMSFVKERPYGLASHSLALILKVTGGRNGTAQTEKGGSNQGGKRWVAAKKAINPIICLLSSGAQLKYLLPAIVMKKQANTEMSKIYNTVKTYDVPVLYRTMLKIKTKTWWHLAPDH